MSPNVAGPIPGVTISAPQVVSPAANAQISIVAQPITLTIKNAQTNGVRPLTYSFQVASDSGFANQVFSKTAIPPGGGGQTAVVMSDKLATATTYYWRARAEDGANTGDWMPTTAFLVFVPVVIQAPTPIQPVGGVKTSSTRPTFIVTNASRSGPAGTIHYVLQVATDQAFTQVGLAGTFPEQANQTSMAFGTDLGAGQHLFWRAMASDGTNDGPWSAVADFVTPTAPAPPPPSPTPSPSPGPSVAPDQINVGAATIWNSPFDLASWTISTAITNVSFQGDGISVSFSKKDGPGRWPDVTPPGWSGPLQYTLGMCFNLSGAWHCSAVIQVWYGLDPAGGPPSQIGQNWFYDPLRWGPMTGHQPASGETVGVFVCEGDCRNNTKGDLSPLRERSNVVLVRFP